jgi:uncharacterized membrane protein
MTATFAPSPWPATAPSASPRSPWRFARELQTPAGTVLLWVLRRNGSLTPRRMLAALAAVSGVALGVALLFWWHGATLVLPFAGLEVAGLAAALLVYARHVGDRETLTLRAGHLRVEHLCAGRVDEADFRAATVRVEPRHGDASLVELSGQGQCMRVGRYVHPQWRPALAQELRRALRSDLGGQIG